MRRLLIAVFASLLAVAPIAPAAHAQIRSLTLDGDLAGGPRNGEVRLGIDYRVTHRNGHERLIPKRVTSFDYLFVPVSCHQGTSVASLDVGAIGSPGAKLTKKRFSNTYTATWAGVIQSTFHFVGQKLWQGRTKWRGQKPKPPGKKFFWKRASGILNIIDWDDLRPGSFTNCTTNGPRSWSAHQCRETSADPIYLPLCGPEF